MGIEFDSVRVNYRFRGGRYAISAPDITNIIVIGTDWEQVMMMADLCMDILIPVSPPNKEKTT